MLSGDNGILQRATDAKTRTDEAQITERIQLAELSARTDGKGILTYSKLNDELTKEFGTKGTGYTISDEDEEIWTVKVGNVEYAIKNEIDAKTKSYLVDIVNIGDYVNLEIPYTNVNVYGGSCTLTGWRVLTINGTDKDGEVTLVSAGCPLAFHRNDSMKGADVVAYLNNLLTNINIITDYSTGFTQNGFNNNDLTSIFSSSPYINTTAGVHALSCGDGSTSNGEIEKVYQAITRLTKNMNDLRYPSYLDNENLKSSSGANWKDSYEDLFQNGAEYWLGGFPDGKYNEWDVWRVREDGWLDSDGSRNYAYVRPVITLKSGIQVSDANTGNGSNVDLAYKITN